MTTTDSLWESSRKIERELSKLLASTEPTFADIDGLIAKYRKACQDLLLFDFDFAVSKQTEERLWEAHLKLNSRYRKLLAKLQGDAALKRPVERRKNEKRYLDFIKSSMRFYREYILQLSRSFGPVPGLEAVGKNLHLDLHPSNNTGGNIPESLSCLVLKSCHSTLVRLGDLSRYRETELKKKDRNWGPAIGYYELATVVSPESGASHNQLAVIARADNNHLRTVYHLYRAQTVQDPFPTAKDNLELEFKKIIDAWKRGELIRPEQTEQLSEALRVGFVCLHARCYKGTEFPEHDELENEFLRQLAVELKERSLDNLLQKICLTNIGAEFLASSRARLDGYDDNEALQAFMSLQRLNVKTFFMLLQVLLLELESYATENDLHDMHNATDRLTATTRRILPALRQYSSWLLSNADLLVAQQQSNLINVQVNEFWKIYANSLTLLAATFSEQDWPYIEYLLDEDEDTVSFQPFFNDDTRARYYKPGTTQLKPRVGGSIERHHPNQEMLSRVHDLILEGEILTKNDPEVSNSSVPIVHSNGRFIYCEDGIPPEVSSSVPIASHKHNASATSISRDDIEFAKQNGPILDRTRPTEDQASQSAMTSMSANIDINHMVDQLVSSDVSEQAATEEKRFGITSSEMPHNHSKHQSSQGIMDSSALWAYPGTPRAGSPIHNGHARAPSMEREETLRPILPSVLNTPFAPMPGETSSPRTRPSTAKALEIVTPSVLANNTTSGVDAAPLFTSTHTPQASFSSPEAPRNWSERPQFGQENVAPSFPMSTQFEHVQMSEDFSYLSDNVTRQKGPKNPAPYGVIGETPPSTQGG